jgi:hypothetical protein
MIDGNSAWATQQSATRYCSGHYAVQNQTPLHTLRFHNMALRRMTRRFADEFRDIGLSKSTQNIAGVPAIPNPGDVRSNEAKCLLGANTGHFWRESTSPKVTSQQ